MTEVPFNWQLHSESKIYDLSKDVFYSNLEINTEWSLVCLWSRDNQNKPAFLEIHRISTAEEIIVSGNIKLMHDMDGPLILQQKFLQWINSGVASTLIELTYFDHYYNEGNYNISGTLKIPAYTVDKEYAKGVQFESLLNLSKDFECLFYPNETCFSDVNVNCGTVSFSAHKYVLSARSPVFAAMFSTQMKESRNNKVDITDLSPQVLKTMLIYIYSGKTEELSLQSAGELLFAADKYKLHDLIRVCSDFLKSSMSAENVLNTLVLGYLHDQDLKMFAMDFICNSCKDFEVLEKTAEWKNLREKRPSLAMDVLTGLVKYYQKLKGSK